MNDLVDRARDLLRGAGHDAHAKRLDSFTGREGVCVRRISPTRVETYMDGTRAVDLAYQAVVRRRSESDAMTECIDIADMLDGADVPSANGSYLFESQEVVAGPQELELDEALFYAWECRVVAHITEC